MSVPISDKFDLLTLLKAGDMIMTVINAKDSQLTVHRFFNKVESFLEETPAFISCLHDMIVVRSSTLFLNELASFKKIIPDIDTHFLNEANRFKEMLIDLGAITFIDIFLELETHIRSKDFSKRDEVLFRLSNQTNGLYNRTKRAHLRPDVQGNRRKHGPDDLLSHAVRALEEEERKRRRRILLVDDMPPFLNAMTAVMSPVYDVYTLANGEQVPGFLQFNEPPDLFLLDVEMPGMDGFAVCNLIRQQEAHAKTPVIFLSGQITDKSMQAAMSMGAADFITKPVNQLLLQESIQNSLPRKIGV